MTITKSSTLSGTGQVSQLLSAADFQAAVDTACFTILDFIPPQYTKVKGNLKTPKSKMLEKLKYFMLTNNIHRASLTQEWIGFENPEDAMLFKLTQQ